MRGLLESFRCVVDLVQRSGFWNSRLGYKMLSRSQDGGTACWRVKVILRGIYTVLEGTLMSMVELVVAFTQGPVVWADPGGCSAVPNVKRLQDSVWGGRLIVVCPAEFVCCHLFVHTCQWLCFAPASSVCVSSLFVLEKLVLFMPR